MLIASGADAVPTGRVIFLVCMYICVRYPVDLVNDLNCGAGSADESGLGTALCRLRGGWQAR